MMKELEELEGKVEFFLARYNNTRALSSVVRAAGS